MFARGGQLCPFTDTSLSYTDPRCFNTTVCPEGYTEYVAPTATTDRVCRRCARCPMGSFSTSTLCTANIADLNCVIDEPCPEGHYEWIHGNSTTPRSCRPCRSCNADEYAAVQCSTTSDRVCAQHRHCPSNQALLRIGNATHDTICRDCDTKVNGYVRPGNDLYQCPPIPFSNVCPVTSAPTPVVPISLYSVVTFSFNGSYNTIVGLPVHTARHELFNSELLAYLQARTDLSENLVSLQSRSGSIIVSVSVQSSNSTTYQAAAASLSALLQQGDFSFAYEGSILTVVSGSVIVTITDPNTTPSPTSAAPTSAPSSTADVSTSGVSSSDDDSDGLGGGVIAAIAIGVLVVIFNIVLLAHHRQKKSDPWALNTVYNPRADLATSDEYLNMQPGEDGTSGSMFSSQVTEENKRLREEVANMDVKLAEKNATISAQLKSRKEAETTLEKAVAAKLTAENRAIQKEIAVMKSELRSKRDASKFQRAAALQMTLKAERAQLEEEIAMADEVTQVALAAVSEYGSLEEAIHENDEAQHREAERIANEKRRLSTEMAKMSERLAAM